MVENLKSNSNGMTFIPCFLKMHCLLQKTRQAYWWAASDCSCICLYDTF